jgi:hypothetical protein
LESKSEFEQKKVGIEAQIHVKDKIEVKVEVQGKVEGIAKDVVKFKFKGCIERQSSNQKTIVFTRGNYNSLRCKHWLMSQSN